MPRSFNPLRFHFHLPHGDVCVFHLIGLLDRVSLRFSDYEDSSITYIIIRY